MNEKFREAILSTKEVKPDSGFEDGNAREIICVLGGEHRNAAWVGRNCLNMNDYPFKRMDYFIRHEQTPNPGEERKPNMCMKLRYAGDGQVVNLLKGYWY